VPGRPLPRHTPLRYAPYSKRVSLPLSHAPAFILICVAAFISLFPGLCLPSPLPRADFLTFFIIPDGSLAQFIEHAADFVFKLPDNVSLDEGALLEPLSVGVHACERGHVGPGSRVLVLGAGPIGLVNLLVAKACGATTVIITDVRDDRLEVAKKLGADVCLRADKPNILEEVRKLGPITHAIEWFAPLVLPVLS
jgi:threonine dehydrogenase-like Zn-dependent dehydrogenase